MSERDAQCLTLMRLAFLVSMAMASLAACGEASLAPLPLDIGIVPSHTTIARNDSVTFEVNMQGGNLLGVEADFGDGETAQFATGGARTARVTFRHAYAAAGTYQMQATVTDATAGQKTASVTVLVN